MILDNVMPVNSWLLAATESCRAKAAVLEARLDVNSAADAAVRASPQKPSLASSWPLPCPPHRHGRLPHAHTGGTFRL
jgi:hypothetical protein